MIRLAVARAVEPVPDDLSRGRFNRVDAAHGGEGRLAPKSIGVVARGDEEDRGHIGPDALGPTTGAYLDWWTENVLPGTIGDGSLDTYVRTVRLYVKPALGRIPLSRLAPSHVTEMMRSMEARGLSAATQNQNRKVLGRALRLAMQEELVRRNAATIADGPPMDRTERRSLTTDQARLLLGELKKERLGTAYMLMLAIGLRRGEVLGLTWDNFDLDSTPPQVTLKRQLQRRLGHGLILVDELKGRKRSWTLALPPQVGDSLRTHKSRQSKERLAAVSPWPDEIGLVFTTPRGTPVDPDNFRHHLADITSGLKMGEWTTHELRHSAGSLLFAMGVPMKVINETLGHSSERVTSEVYVHLMAQARVDAADAMTKALWGS
jgi:integrase